MLNQRIYERHSSRIDGRIMDLSELDESQITVEDFSLTGLGVSSLKPMPVGAEVKVWVNTPTEKELYCSGKVVWSKEDSEKIFRMGIEFHEFKMHTYRTLEHCSN